MNPEPCPRFAILSAEWMRTERDKTASKIAKRNAAGKAQRHWHRCLKCRAVYHRKRV